MVFRKRTRYFIITVVTALFAAGTPVSAQSQKDQIKSELYIMENILGQLLKASRDNWFNDNRIQGVHLDDFGLLFTVNLERNIFSVGVVADGLPGDVSVTVPEPMLFSQRGQRDSSKSAEIMDKLDKKVRTFLGTYVDVNNHLRDAEKVGVLVLFDSGFHSEKRTYYYQSTKKTISDYRSKRLSETQFENAITRDMADNEAAREEVSIMGTILGSIFRGSGGFRTSRQVTGVHIKGLGVMYTLGTPATLEDVLVDSFAPVAVPDKKGARELAIRAETREKEREQKWQEKLADYENKIVKLVGDYGSSLRFLPDDQSVFVILGTNTGFIRSGTAKHVMIRIKKGDVMNYSQSRIDLQELVRRAQLERF